MRPTGTAATAMLLATSVFGIAGPASPARAYTTEEGAINGTYRRTSRRRRAEPVAAHRDADAAGQDRLTGSQLIRRRFMSETGLATSWAPSRVPGPAAGSPSRSQ